jgi:hypothetical protein
MDVTRLIPLSGESHLPPPREKRGKNHSQRHTSSTSFLPALYKCTLRTDFSKTARDALAFVFFSPTRFGVSLDTHRTCFCRRCDLSACCLRTARPTKFTFSHVVLELPPPPHSRSRAPSWRRVPMTRCWMSPSPRMMPRLLRSLMQRLLRSLPSTTLQ